VKKFVCFVLLCFLLFSVVGFFCYLSKRNTIINTKDLEIFIEKIDNEKEESVAYTFFDFVNFDNCKLHLSEHISDTKYNVLQVFCINEGKIYFLCEYNDSTDTHWCIASIDLDGGDFKKHTDNVFLGTYTIDFTIPYDERTGYYYDQTIVLTDFKKLIEYDIRNQTFIVHDYEKYQHPQKNISWNIENNEKITFHTQTKDIVVNKENFAKSNHISNELLSSFDKKIWSGKSSLYSLFDSVQLIDDEIYIICRVLNYRGSTYALIFHYNLEQQEYRFCGSYFTRDIINQDEFYVVPR